MKKNILGIILSLGATLSCNAQLEHRISYSFGFASHAFHQERKSEREYVEYSFPGVYDHGTYEYTQEDINSFPITFNLQYDCSLREHIGVGFCIGYERQNMYQKTTYIRSNGEQISPFGNTYTLWENEHRKGELTRRILYIMPEFTAYWFKKRHVAMYSKGAIGARFNFDSRKFYSGSPISEKMPTASSVSLYFQVSPVGVEVGGQRWRGVVELGYGAQGFIQYGVRHILKGKATSTEMTVE